ncbi:hypothetical protein A2839_04980 [Candidatus Uhrbacteria bacterium RIFCSPHIGHO2_01_FULL_47_10]|nr:MAG: hypothetical protein A2839_04980 [Candidatus Uhrbacteria bacterium RIFCSPHIGHO2_01_FULL_47_10]
MDVLHFRYMNPFLRIFLGFIVMVIGYFIVSKSEKMFEWFGQNEFAEKYIGSGGSRTFYKIIGILVVFVGIFIATNVMSDILGGTAKVLTNT